MKKITTFLILLIAFFAINIGVNAQNIVSTTPSTTNVNCNGSASLDPSFTSTNWSWNQGTILLQNGGTYIDSLCPGTYELIYLDANNTYTTFTFTITLSNTNPCSNSTLQASFGPTPVSAAGICDGSISINASGGVPPYQYKLNDGPNQTYNVFNNLCADTYNVVVVDNQGCTFYSTVVVQGGTTNPCTNSTLQASATPSPSSNSSSGTCDGSITVTAGGGVAPYQFMLNNGPNQTMYVFNNLCPGTYSLIVTDAQGCTNYSSVVVQADSTNPCVNSTLQSNFVATPVSFADTCDGSITVNTTGGLTPYQYMLNNGPNQSTNVFNNLCADNYSLTVTDAQGCSNYFPVIIQVDGSNPCTSSTLAATLNTINATTPNSCDGVVHVVASGGVAPYMFSGDMGATYVNFNSFPNMCVGDHVFMVKDQAGCSITITGMVYVDSTNAPCANSQLSVVLNGTNATTPINCDGTLSALVSGFGSGFTYEWSNNLGNSSLNLENLCPGMYSISVHSEGCTIIMHKHIGINSTSTDCDSSTLTGMISGTNATDISTCNGSIIISGNGGTEPYQYSIDDGATIVSTPDFTDLCAGQYYVGLADADGCVLHFIHYVGIDSMSTSNPCENSTLSVALMPTPVSSPNLCDGTVTAIVTGGIAPITPFWSAGSNASANTLTLTDLCSDIYTLYVMDANGCTMTSSVYVGGYIDSTVAANMGINGYVMPVGVSDDGLCDGNASVIVYGGVQPFTYLYSNGDTTSNAFGLCAGLQNVVVTDANGESVSFDFIIGSPINTTSTGNFMDSTIVDSVYTDPIIDCFVNFAMIDSAFISGFTILPNDSIIVNWGVVFNDSLVTVTNTYGLTIGGASAAAGVYMITLQLYCPDKATGNFLSATDQIYYSQENIGINEIGIENNNILIYPNPFHDQITISLEKLEASQIIITDITGKVIIDKKFNNQLFKIDMNGLSPGQYIVSVKSDSLNFTRKIIK